MGTANPGEHHSTIDSRRDTGRAYIAEGHQRDEHREAEDHANLQAILRGDEPGAHQAGHANGRKAITSRAQILLRSGPGRRLVTNRPMIRTVEFLAVATFNPFEEGVSFLAMADLRLIRCVITLDALVECFGVDPLGPLAQFSAYRAYVSGPRSC